VIDPYSLEQYRKFLATKRTLAQPCGFEISESKINPRLFAFQKDTVRFDLMRGKAANFAHTGLGKGPMQMEWCGHVSERAKGDTLIAAPLCVAQQFKREAIKFNYDVTLCKDQGDVRRGINVTNYDRLDQFDLTKFVGVSLDESSILKDWTSKTSSTLIERLKATPYKLCSSATPSPNDHAELGTHCELLDVMRRPAMLAMFFEHDGGETSKWSLKGHGKKPFFRFCASWSVCIKRPSDLGYPDDGFDIPPLNMIEHVVPIDYGVESDGMLYRSPDLSATGLHKEMRLTAEDRALKTAEIVLGVGWGLKPKHGNLYTCGNQNTKSIGVENSRLIQNTPREPETEDRELQKKTPYTCESTIETTNQNGQSQDNAAKQRSTLASGTCIDPIQQSGNITSRKAKSGGQTIQTNFSINDSARTELQGQTINDYLGRKAEDALFAGPKPLTNDANDSTLTTVTKQERLEGCYAETVTSESGSSNTQKIRYVEPSRISELPQWIVWCNTDYEQTPLERLFGELCISIRGSMRPEEKEKRILRWLNNEKPILLTKPSIAGSGLNLQQCHNMVFVGLSYSFEAFFQAIRRCWRFGQLNSVDAHIVIAETEGPVLATIRRKEAQYEELQSEMNEAMREEQLLARHKATRYDHEIPMEVPNWLVSEVA
jgi:hypothetical protein